MITGGLGFIGSNLARALVDLGANVLLVDSLIPDYGGNLFNVDGLAGRVQINVADIRQQSTMNYLVRDRDVIFSLAGQVSHIDSMRDPTVGSTRSRLAVLERAATQPGREGRLRGTRQVYGSQTAAGHRASPVGPTDQRHQQGGRRELPPGLQQRVRCAAARCG
jgi:UDP-glucose 4-epimerase